jgi:hypothetical protein
MPAFTPDESTVEEIQRLIRVDANRSGAGVLSSPHGFAIAPTQPRRRPVTDESLPELQRFQVQEIDLGTNGVILRCHKIGAGAPGSHNAFTVGTADVYVKKRHAHALLDELYAYRPQGKTDLTDFIPSGATDPIVVEWLEAFGPPKKGKYKIVQEIDDYGTFASDYPHFHL